MTKYNNVFRAPFSSPPPPPPHSKKKNDGIKIILERLKLDQKFNAYGGSRRVQSKTQQKLIQGKICAKQTKQRQQTAKRKINVNQ